MHTKFFKLHGLRTCFSTACPRLLTNLGLFSQQIAGCAQLRFKKKLPDFFGEYQQTTEWSLRSFTSAATRAFTMKTGLGCGFQHSMQLHRINKMQLL